MCIKLFKESIIFEKTKWKWLWYSSVEPHDNRQADNTSSKKCCVKIVASRLFVLLPYRFVLVKFRILIASCIEQNVCLICQMSFSWITCIIYRSCKTFFVKWDGFEVFYNKVIEWAISARFWCRSTCQKFLHNII